MKSEKNRHPVFIWKSTAEPPPKPCHKQGAFQTAPKTASRSERKQREEEKQQEIIWGTNQRKSCRDQEAGTGWTVTWTPIFKEKRKSTRQKGHGFEWLRSLRTSQSASLLPGMEKLVGGLC